jgi:hypothetical protein
MGEMSLEVMNPLYARDPDLKPKELGLALDGGR